MAGNYENNHGAAALAVLAAMLGAAVGPRAAAQDSEKLTVDVNDCLAIEKRDERLACFDTQVEAARRRNPSQRAPAEAAAPVRNAEPAAPPAASTAAADAPKERRRARSDDDFGRKEQARELEPEIVAKVAELRETVPNAYVITLDNGQVWRQSQPQRYPLRPGLEVRLRETKFGYRLTAPEYRGQIPVERVQ